MHFDKTKKPSLSLPASGRRLFQGSEIGKQRSQLPGQGWSAAATAAVDKKKHELGETQCDNT